MFTMSSVIFACGIGIGVVFATTCITVSTLYHSYIEDKKAVKKRKEEKIRRITGDRMKQLPEPKVLQIEHKFL